jgi:hypothetical protein
MKKIKSVYSESCAYAIIKAVFHPFLRPAFCRCLPSIVLNFFLRQYHSVFLKKIPVTDVDHPLDDKIQFVPSWVTIYLDFVQYWVRMLAFFLRRYNRRALPHVRDFIFSMGSLYAYAAQVYSKNLSTTKRPFYIARPRFFLIHMVDPHLMCIPSLHVMVVVHAYTMFEKIAKSLGEEENLKDQIIEMKQGALAIVSAILFIKQHSVNCIPASLYAMTCFSPDIFPPKEAETFVEQFFSPPPSADKAPKDSKVHPAASPLTKLPPADIAEIKAHVLSLYRRFLDEKDSAKPWNEPVLNFLRTYSVKN